MEEVDKEISEMKLSVNTRARTVAESYLAQVMQESYKGDLIWILISLFLVCIEDIYHVLGYNKGIIVPASDMDL